MRVVCVEEGGRGGGGVCVRVGVCRCLGELSKIRPMKLVLLRPVCRLHSETRQHDVLRDIASSGFLGMSTRCRFPSHPHEKWFLTVFLAYDWVGSPEESSSHCCLRRSQNFRAIHGAERLTFTSSGGVACFKFSCTLGT